MARICIIQPTLGTLSETFITMHNERLPGVVEIVYSKGNIPFVRGETVLSQRLMPRAKRKIGRHIYGHSWDREVSLAYEKAIREARPDVVLVEFGVAGAKVSGLLERMGIPFVVHFHGYDASRHDILKKREAAYRRMFSSCAAVVAVSRKMETALRRMGCPEEKLVYSPYGIDCDLFQGAAPLSAEPTLLSVGRMVAKKAPHLSLLAFSRMLPKFPDARLHMIGDGPLKSVCEDLIEGLGISKSVSLFGARPQKFVRDQMSNARAFVQHSIVAADGDTEGTPVAILEACATGLAIIATRHAGIPDVVVEGQTGLLCPEKDVEAMAANMARICDSAELAAQFGRNGAARVREFYTAEQSIQRLNWVLEAAANRKPITVIRRQIEDTLPKDGKPELDSQASVPSTI